MGLGRAGIWSIGLRSEAPDAKQEIQAGAAELERLGYGAIWLGGSPGVRHAEPLLAATSSITVATGILSIWSDEPATVAAQHAELTADHPGRFLLGLGASHSVLAKNYNKPYSAMVDFLDGLDAAPTPVPREERVLAALGPKMLSLSGERTLGAHPYLVTPGHTAQARERLGDGPLLAPEIKVVPERDPDLARARARTHLATYLELPNYTNNLLRLGFTEDDLTAGGSDHLVDATFAWGDQNAIRTRITEFEQAGADHVVLQIITDDPSHLPLPEWRTLAQTLDLTPR